MNRFQLEHAVLAASRITGEKEFVVIGSQSIHGYLPDAPGRLSESMEIDMYPLSDPSKGIEIDANMGQGTLFEDTHAFYAHQVGPETATLPSRWKDRLIKIATEKMEGAVALCLHPVDLAFSKLYAGREKDVDFVAALFTSGVITPEDIRRLSHETSVEIMSRICNALSICENKTANSLKPSPPAGTSPKNPFAKLTMPAPSQLPKKRGRGV